MRIAPVAQASPATPAIAAAPAAPAAPVARAVTITPGMSQQQLDASMQAIATDSSPGAMLMRRNGGDLLSLPGVVSVQHLWNVPDVVTVTFADDAFLALGDSVISDAVDGATIELRSETPGTPSTLPWWSSAVNPKLYAIRAMSGVIDITRISEYGRNNAMVYTTGKNVADRLRPLINPTIGGWHISVLPLA